MKNRNLEIITFLLGTRSSHKIICAAFQQSYSKKQISNTLGHLKKRGYVDNTNGQWEITDSGKKYRENIRYQYFEAENTHKSKKDMLVMFDIPESERSKRDWLRYQIKRFHYVQIQKSVWYGPSPLPKKFMDYLKVLKIKDNIKIFKTNNKII